MSGAGGHAGETLPRFERKVRRLEEPHERRYMPNLGEHGYQRGYFRRLLTSDAKR